ncbi:hypothetical protein K7432_002367 [Basidiobolus ranarum]|uniref:FHA domain-containing protein n=1 Tax=Basidiobolus ranarum TaxID=34480 RepID=A0ABR2W7V7_9FUNG
MSTIAIYKLFGEKNIDRFEVSPRKRVSRRSMRTYSLDDVSQLPPTLVLTSLSHTFPTKKFELFDKIPIGRQVSPKTSPDVKNGYFDSKVLSRTHAEVWSENGQVYIRDLKSSNGTYLNEVRLSPEGVESPPFELKNGDVLEFGIDIQEIDKIEYRKISCKVEILRDSILNSKSNLSSSPEKITSPRIITTMQNQLHEDDNNPIPSQPDKLEEWKIKLRTELARLTNDGFEINQLTSTLVEIASEFGGHKQGVTFIQDSDSCHSLQNGLNQSNKAPKESGTTRLSPFNMDIQCSSIGIEKESNSETEKLKQQVAQIMEENRAFRSVHTQQQSFFDNKVAGILGKNRELSVENQNLREKLLEEKRYSEHVKKSLGRTQDILESMGKRIKSLELEIQKRNDAGAKEPGKDLEQVLLRKNSELRRQMSSFDGFRSLQTPEWKFRHDENGSFSTIKVKECNTNISVCAPEIRKEHNALQSHGYP